MVRSKILNHIKGLDHFFLDKVESKSVFTALLLKKSFTCQQIHQNKVAEVIESHYYPNCDGLLTGKKAWLCLKTADCLPVFLYSADKKILAALHAGWRGLSLNIVAKATCVLEKKGVDLKNVFVAIGPHISRCCYQVGSEIVNIFTLLDNKNKSYVRTSKGNIFLDLGAITVNQLINIGIPKSNIEDVDICTSCHKEFNSLRRERTLDRNYNFIKLI